MKTNTRKYIRILDAQINLIRKIKSIYCFGEDWQKQRTKKDKLEQKLLDYENKLTPLSSLITQEEFEEHLSDRMCCSWEDFNN